MTFWTRCLLIGVFLAWDCAWILAAEPPSPEDRAFYSATEAFRGGFFERAEKECSQFASQFPASARIPEAVLMQAQARVQLKDYSGAVELLSGGLAAAGIWADHYLFWLGEACAHKGDYRAAADYFSRLVRDYPDSTRRLEAAVSEASARSKLGQWSEVVNLVGNTNGVVQVAARSNPTNSLVVRAFLMLSEAYLAQNEYRKAEQALSPLAGVALQPRLDWQRHYLLCRIQLAQGRPADALAGSSNLLVLATNAAEPQLLADSAVFQAGVFERLGRLGEAVRAYQRNLAEGVSGERQRQALLKITELSLAENNLEQATQTLEKFWAQHPTAPAADLALLTLGELRLRQFVHAAGDGVAGRGATNAVATTNWLAQAQAAFNELIEKFPQSPLLGKAQLDLGWCLWMDGKTAESRTAFESATGLLKPSADLAVAHFKLGDACFQRRDFTNALANYKIVEEQFAGIDEVKTNLVERALYQEVRVALAAGDVSSAARALTNIVGTFPEGFHAERALLLVGGELGRRGNPAAARELFESFLRLAPNAPLLPELQLAIARTYEREGKWGEVIENYDQWLGQFTNHAARPRAEYDRAWACWQAGRETNALAGFTNFVARYPSHELTPLAQWWVADYFFRTGDPFEAEKNYQLLFKSTNWPPSQLTYEAQLMAGRAAMARLSWEDAQSYFRQLYNDTNCPYTDLRVQALFSYGDYWMSRDSTNKLADYDEAISTFNGIISRHPTNRLAVLAVGKIASCYLQRAQSLQDYELARTNFLQLAAATNADVTARSIATVGLATVLEKEALQRTGAEQARLRKQALDYYLDVFYQKILRQGETADLFWTRKAGLDAAALLESMQDWGRAIGVYEQLQEMIPTMRSRLEKSILRAREQIARGKG